MLNLDMETKQEEKYPRTEKESCIITDTKFTDSDVFSIQFDSMMEDARELGSKGSLFTYLRKERE